MAKYEMTNAAAKRISAALIKHGGRSTIKQIHEALTDEGFTGHIIRLDVQRLIDYWMNQADGVYTYLLAAVTRAYVHEYYEQREGIRDLTAGLQRLGVISYPEDD